MLKKAATRSKGVRYAPKFKRDCLELMSAGMTLEAVADEKGVSTVSLGRWKKAAQQDGSYPEEGRVTDESAAAGDQDEVEPTGPGG